MRGQEVRGEEIAGFLATQRHILENTTHETAAGLPLGEDQFDYIGHRAANPITAPPEEAHNAQLSNVATFVFAAINDHIHSGQGRSQRELRRDGEYQNRSRIMAAILEVGLQVHKEVADGGLPDEYEDDVIICAKVADLYSRLGDTFPLLLSKLQRGR